MELSLESNLVKRSSFETTSKIIVSLPSLIHFEESARQPTQAPHLLLKHTECFAVWRFSMLHSDRSTRNLRVRLPKTGQRAHLLQEKIVVCVCVLERSLRGGLIEAHL